jgi:high-affinity K+ transport system ATPase subunit B
MKRFRIICLSLAACLLPAAAPAADSDELWEISTRVVDKPGNITVSSRAQKQCLRQGAKADEVMPLRAGCKMLDEHPSGSIVTFRFQCSGKEQLTGSGEIDRPDADSYTGSMQMQGISNQGREVDVQLSFVGKRIGNCTFAQPPAEPPQ